MADKTDSVILAVTVLYLLAALAFWGSVGYIAYHFIPKAW